ncbi:MAG TPA: Rieske (2Fe-2S) protein [Nocardioides sp.]|nr:Rieske (2Fe-2S) protein [Nocardioides sp.]
MTAPVSRRQALAGAAATGIGVPLLAACAGSSGTGSGGTGGSGGAASAPKAGNALVATADVPVGGGVVLAQQGIVVTQPTQGDFKAFSAVCTHAGCTVSGVSGGEITCPCHGSQFSITDGSVDGGPAPSALPSVPVQVKGDQVVAG